MTDHAHLTIYCIMLLFHKISLKQLSMIYALCIIYLIIYKGNFHLLSVIIFPLHDSFDCNYQTDCPYDSVKRTDCFN